jgi:D-sedoheptulose 7-phosphate isomerase
MTTKFQQNLEEHRALFARLEALAEPVARAAGLIVGALTAGRKLLLCGNGGSAADAQHMAAEFTGRFIKDRKPLAALALSTDSSALTCIANDYSFDEVFYRQVVGLGQAGDCLLAISTSGNSKNVLRAVEGARGLGLRSIGLLGRDGGQLAGQCDVAIIVPSPSTARIQEAHIMIIHTLCGMIEESLQLA